MVTLVKERIVFGRLENGHPIFYSRRAQAKRDLTTKIEIVYSGIDRCLKCDDSGDICYRAPDGYQRLWFTPATKARANIR